MSCQNALDRQACWHMASAFSNIAWLNLLACPFCWGVWGIEVWWVMPLEVRNVWNSYHINSPSWSECMEVRVWPVKVSAQEIILQKLDKQSDLACKKDKRAYPVQSSMKVRIYLAWEWGFIGIGPIRSVCTKASGQKAHLPEAGKAQSGIFPIWQSLQGARLAGRVSKGTSGTPVP